MSGPRDRYEVVVVATGAVLAEFPDRAAAVVFAKTENNGLQPWQYRRVDRVTREQVYP